jgi:oligopeptide transport system substrate-binding protein
VSLNGIRFLPISNIFTEARMFRDGQLHITSGAAPEVVDLMERENPAVLRQEPYLGVQLYRFNTTREPFDDERVRHALSMAIDREALCKSVFRGYTEAYGMTPPIGKYDPPHEVSFNPEAARKLMEEAGYPGGKGFPRKKLLIASRETASTLATAVQAMWREHLGVEVEIENREWTAYLEATRALEFDIVAGGWIGDYTDPLTFLEMWTPTSSYNNTGWESQAYADKIEESFKITDPAERFEVLRDAEKIFLDAMPATPLAWVGKNYLIDPAVKGWDPLILDNHPYTKVELIPQETSR